jgi:peptidoglycan L-alanyl-D-glutamate endopeptidase CwlK
VYAGQVDRFGFTGIVLGASFIGGGSSSFSARAMIAGIPVAQYVQAMQVMGDLAEAMKVGVFQFFNRLGMTFSRTQLPDVAANAPTASWRTPQNLAVLDSLDPYVANLAAQHLSQMTEEGLDVRLTQGFRTYSYQNDLYDQGRTRRGHIVTDVRGGESLHNFGLAYDVGVFDSGQYVKRGADPRYRRVGVLGEGVADGIGAARLRWGGRWSKPDSSHFEFDGGLPLAEIRRRFETGEPAF